MTLVCRFAFGECPIAFRNPTCSLRLTGYDSLSKSVTVLANHAAALDAQLNKGGTRLATCGQIPAIVLVPVIVSVVAVLLLRRRKAQPPAT